MRSGKRRLRDGAEPNEKFETEAFAFLNEEQEAESRKKKKKHDNESDSEPDFSGESESEVEEEVVVGDAAADDDDSDDEAPDDIGFADSKKSIMTQLRTAVQQVDEDKRKKKEQRRKLDAQFKEQRANKKERLAQSKLPTDFFNDLDEEIPKKPIKPTEPQVTDNTKQSQPDAEVKEEKLDDDDGQDEPNDDFIPLSDSPERVTVTTIKDLQKKTKTAAQTALEFRQNRLYGNHIRRQTNKQRLAAAEKKKYARKR